MRSRILSTGSYLPERVVTNFDMAEMLPTSDEWIQQRSGIRERHFASPEDSPASMGTIAAQRAMQAADLRPEDVDLLICATQTPDHQFPGTGCLIQERLGLKTIGALDVRAQCSGFIYGLSVADAYIRAGIYRRILLVCTEIHSRALDFSERGRQVAVLFGDGAGAAVLGPSEEEGRGLLSVDIHSDGRFAYDLMLEAPGFSFTPWCTHEMIDQGRIYPHMNGRTVFKEAVSSMRGAIQATLTRNQISVDDVDHLIPHQANRRINEAVANHFGFPESKVNHSIEFNGNCGAASVPLALDEWVRSGRIRPHDVVLLASFAAGFTWGAVAMRW